jgi:hypothetical protein
VKKLGQRSGLWLLTFGMLISSCATPSSIEPTSQPVSTALPSEVAEATASPRPTLGPTATVWPPVFDPYGFEDIRDLASFVVTISEKNTVNGNLTELITTIGYIKEPYTAYAIAQFPGGESQTYSIEGRTYEINGSGDWYITARTNDDLFSKADIPGGNTYKLVDAQFVAEEDYQGIVAYHFVLEPAAQSDASYQLEGDFYLAKDGNYVLYSHWMETVSQSDFSQVYEVTQTITSINQLSEISIPAEIQEMRTAMDLPEEFGLPLPPESSPSGMIRYVNGIGIDSYTFSTPKTSIEEFLEYYRDLAPTDGWAVSHVGHVNLHENDCEFSRECVIITKGPIQVILYYNGATIRAEFDWPHLFSPIS